MTSLFRIRGRIRNKTKISNEQPQTRSGCRWKKKKNVFANVCNKLVERVLMKIKSIYLRIPVIIEFLTDCRRQHTCCARVAFRRSEGLRSAEKSYYPNVVPSGATIRNIIFDILF